MPGEIDRSAYIDSPREDLSEEERQEATAEFEPSLEASGAVSDEAKEEARLALNAAIREEAEISALAAEELSERLKEHKKPELESKIDLKQDEPPPKMRNAVGAGVLLGATGTVIFGGRLIKKGAQLVSGLFTSIERWADNKLKKHPILSKVIAVGALPFTVWGLIGPWTAGLTAPLTGWLSNKWLGKEARKSWAEQEAEEAKKQEKK